MSPWPKKLDAEALRVYIIVYGMLSPLVLAVGCVVIPERYRTYEDQQEDRKIEAAIRRRATFDPTLTTPNAFHFAVILRSTDEATSPNLAAAAQQWQNSRGKRHNSSRHSILHGVHTYVVVAERQPNDGKIALCFIDVDRPDRRHVVEREVPSDAAPSEITTEEYFACISHVVSEVVQRSWLEEWFDVLRWVSLIPSLIALGILLLMASTMTEKRTAPWLLLTFFSAFLAVALLGIAIILAPVLQIWVPPVLFLPLVFRSLIGLYYLKGIDCRLLGNAIGSRQYSHTTVVTYEVHDGTLQGWEVRLYWALVLIPAISFWVTFSYFAYLTRIAG